MRGVAVLAAIAVAGWCWSAAAEPGRNEPYPGLAISDNPSAVEQRAFVEEIFKNWDVKALDTPYSAPCSAAAASFRAGMDVTYLVPEAFGETAKPEAITEIERRCPYLYLGATWENHGSDPMARSLSFVEPVTEKDKMQTYGEPMRTSRNFALYRLRFPDTGVPRAVFMASDKCRDGTCYPGSGDYSLIDEQQCLREDRTKVSRRASKGKPGPAVLWTIVQIKERFYFLEAGESSVIVDSTGHYTTGGPGMWLWPIPTDVKPHPVSPTEEDLKPSERDMSSCPFISPAARR